MKKNTKNCLIFKNFLKNNPKFNFFLVTKPENIFWLTGFFGSFGFFLQTKKSGFLVTDSRYAEFAKKITKKLGLEFLLFDKDLKKNLEKFLPKEQKTCAIEDSIPIAKFKNLKKYFKKTKFIPQSNVIENLRQIKTDDEIKKIKKAQSQVDKILLPFFQQYIKKNITEKKAAFILEQMIRDQGEFELSFPPIVAFGKNSAIPHHQPTNQKINKNENILIDCGAKYQGYCSDITRNFYFGTPSSEFINKFEILKKAQNQTLKKFIPGESYKNTEKFCRKILGEDANFFTHSLGHGVGLEIHELPYVSSKEKKDCGKNFQPNQVVTCEPGIYFPEKFGIRIEDLVWIKKDGNKILSRTNKNLYIKCRGL